MTLPRKRLTTKGRRELYRREAAKARDAGLGEHPICNIAWCGLPVLPGQSWDESHDGIPHAFGGTVVGVAHSRCNRIHGAQVVVPAVAKSKRVRERHLDIARTARPLPGGRFDRLRKTMTGRVVERGTR
jgi:hypothetical protein